LELSSGGRHFWMTRRSASPFALQGEDLHSGCSPEPFEDEVVGSVATLGEALEGETFGLPQGKGEICVDDIDRDVGAAFSQDAFDDAQPQGDPELLVH
jgi:hypothetical protein